MMDNKELMIGEIYNVDSHRKGKFQMRITQQDDTWATGVITNGLADAIMGYNTREEGEEVTVRKSWTSFTHSQVKPDN